MPQYTYPIQAGELKLPALFGLSTADARAIGSVGLVMPALAWATAVIDTGTTITSVAAVVLRRLGTEPITQATTTTATGESPVDLYRVSLSIPAPGPSKGPMLTFSDLLVMAMPQVVPGVDALIGLDVLLGIRFSLDGPSRSFTLDF